MKLYSDWRSSSSWRVRLALHHKGLPFETVPVDLLKGEQHTPAHLARNALGTVPLLEVEDEGRVLQLAQSVAIAEYLEERWPERPLFPTARGDRALVRALAETVNSFIQPFQNLSVMKHVKHELHADEKAWAVHFVGRGLAMLEAEAKPTAGAFLFGDQVSWADCCLVPQLASARRFGIDLAPFPTLLRAEASFAPLPVFGAAHPDAQPDAVKP
jgi:maleylpyruvate isomerase